MERLVFDDTPLVVANGLDPILLSDDELFIQHGTRSRPSELIRDGELRGILGIVVGRLSDGPATLAELTALVPEGDRDETEDLLQGLVERGVLVPNSTDPVEQYIRYTFTGTNELASRTVALVGAGPVGLRIASGLLQHGVGRVTFVDERPADRVFPSRPPAQAPAGNAGVRADQAAARWLKDAGWEDAADAADAGSPAGEVAVRTAVERSDMTVVAFERPSLARAHAVNRLSIRARKPWLLTTVDGSRALIGPLFLPVETACFNDYQTLADATSPIRAMLHKQRKQRPGSARPEFLGLPVYGDLVAAHATLGVIHFLLRGTCFALARVMVIDFERMTIDVEDVLKLPRCPVCGDQRAAYRPVVGIDAAHER